MQVLFDITPFKLMYLVSFNLILLCIVEINITWYHYLLQLSKLILHQLILYDNSVLLSIKLSVT